MTDTLARSATDVCYVNAQGELICGVSLLAYDASADKEIKECIEKTRGALSPGRWKLIAQLINEVLACPIDDKCVTTRSTDVVGSVQVLLDAPPPVMLLYRYTSLPGDIMAAYDMQQHKIKAACDAQGRWGKTKPAC
jgi:hypothetical protein